MGPPFRLFLQRSSPAVNEVLFYFTEKETTVPACPEKKLLIFLRSCDLHALKRLDTIYLNNGPQDFYYDRLRQRAAFVLMGCSETCDNGFCVSMETNRTDAYDLYLKLSEESVWIDCKSETLLPYFTQADTVSCAVTPDFVTANKEEVRLPRHLSTETFSNPIWESYGNRCIGCGRCNFVCPTCTCFTMQDISYREKCRCGRTPESLGFLSGGRLHRYRRRQQFPPEAKRPDAV